MREYAKISPKFWIGKTGKSLRGDIEAQVVAFYLLSNPHSTMIGLYYLPIHFISHETGMTIEGASKGLRRCIEGGFCGYDSTTEFVWVYEMARYQVGEALSESDKRCKGIQSQYDDMPDNPFLSQFYDKYSSFYHLSGNRESSYKIASPFEGASMTHRSKEKEKEQETDKETDKDCAKTTEPPPSPKKRVAKEYVPSEDAKRLVIAWERNSERKAQDRTRAHENIDRLMKKTGLTFEDLGQAMVRYFTECDEKGMDKNFYYKLTNFYGQKGYYRDYLEQP